MFAHVKTRVAMWLNPWSDALGKGYQLVQALTAIASGGLFGVGLGMGQSRVIPAYSTDFIFAVLCEQFGILFGLCVLALYGVIVLRGIALSMRAQDAFHALLALGIALMIGLQTFTIIGGVIKLIPLTGITLPFVSYGGTSLVASMGMIGMLCGVAAMEGKAD
jgi:cell division protein FtsW (lipid II flippase)